VGFLWWGVLCFFLLFFSFFGLTRCCVFLFGLGGWVFSPPDRAWVWLCGFFVFFFLRTLTSFMLSVDSFAVFPCVSLLGASDRSVVFPLVTSLRFGPS